MSFPWSFIFRSSRSSTSSPRSKALLVSASNSCFLEKIKEENRIIVETDLYKSPSRTQNFDLIKDQTIFLKVGDHFFISSNLFSLRCIDILRKKLKLVTEISFLPKQPSLDGKQSLLLLENLWETAICKYAKAARYAGSSTSEKRGCSGFIQHFCNTLYACRMFGTKSETSGKIHIYSFKE